MPEEENWVARCIAKVHESQPGVNEAVVNRLRDLLVGQMCERPLRHLELVNTAKTLIADMAADSSHKAVSPHED